MSTPFTILQGRSCGSCSLCCKLLPIVKNDLFPFEKPAGVMCEHFKQGIGCSIHDVRPQGCRNWFCEWVKGNLPDELKPDTINAVIERRRVEDLEYLLILQDSAHPVHEKLRQFIMSNVGLTRMLIYDVPLTGQQYLVGLGATDEARKEDQTKLIEAFTREGSLIEAK